VFRILGVKHFWVGISFARMSCYAPCQPMEKKEHEMMWFLQGSVVQSQI